MEHGTCGRSQAQWAEFGLAAEYKSMGFGCAGRDWMPYSALIDTLDAPEVMPAGAMNSTEWTNGRGNPVAHASEVCREV